MFPGYVALRVAPDLLATLLADRTVCVVSGTNGKTTTTAMISAAFGDDVTTNTDGANLPNGWVERAARSTPAVARSCWRSTSRTFPPRSTRRLRRSWCC